MEAAKYVIEVPVGKLVITGNLTVPEAVHGIVIFSHGSGSSRFSPRNRYVADVLNEKGFATLLIDLLTPEEDEVYQNRFDIGLLTDRLKAVTEYVHELDTTSGLPIGYFGASTGAASALKAAAALGERIQAVVSRGGRPDLAKEDLSNVNAPVLLIVGGMDLPVIQVNEFASAQLRCKKEMVIVDDATHLFEEAGKLEEVAVLAAKWFTKYLRENNTEHYKHLHHDF